MRAALDAVLVAARALEEEGDVDAALELLGGDDPAGEGVRAAARAAILLRAGRLAEAEVAARRARALEPAAANHAMNLAVVLMERARREPASAERARDARALLDEVLAPAPADAPEDERLRRTELRAAAMHLRAAADRAAAL